MNVLEKEIEELFYHSVTTGKKAELRKRGFYNTGAELYFRQLRIGNYGVADVVSFDYDARRKVLTVGIHEFKKGAIGSETLLQAIRYANGIKHYVSKNSCIEVEAKFILVGTSVEKGSFIYVPNFFDDVFIYTVSIDLELGVKFHIYQDYVLSNPGLDKVSENNVVSEVSDHIKKSIRKKVKDRQTIDDVLGKLFYN